MTRVLSTMGYSGKYYRRTSSGICTADGSTPKLGILICLKFDEFEMIYSEKIKMNELKDMCEPHLKKRYNKTHIAAVAVIRSLTNPKCPPLMFVSPHISANYTNEDVQMMQL